MSKSHVSGRASEPTPAQMKEFFAQVESGRITREGLQAFLRGQEPAFPSYSVTVNYGQTIEQLVEAGQYDWVNGVINSRNFLSREKGEVQIDIHLLNFDRTSSEDIISAMDRQGFRPASLEELLALGAAYPDLQRENPIVALGSTYPIDQGVPCLSRNDGYRRLSLIWFEGDWGPSWRFAAVRK